MAGRKLPVRCFGVKRWATIRAGLNGAGATILRANRPGQDNGMLDSIVFQNAGKRIDKIEAGLQRQTGWNPERDAQLPALAEEAARLRAQLAEARIAWESAPERRNTRVVGLIFGVCGLAAAVLGFFGLLPAFAGVALGFALKGSIEANRRLKQLFDAMLDLEGRVFVTVEIVQRDAA
jgi:hypothetical protein